MITAPLTPQHQPPQGHARTLITYLSYLGLAASLLLGACSTLTPATSQPSAKITAERQYQERLLISGRMQVRYQQNNKEQSLPGSFEWKQEQDSTTIELISPLGQTMASISQNASGATLQQAGQAPRTADNLDHLLTETLGWPLPVSGLRDWLQGYTRAANGQRAALKAQDNLIINADGWQLRYVTWIDEGGQLRPKRIDLQRYTEQAGEVSMRLAIDQWKLP